MQLTRLSIVIPAYNEADTITQVLDTVFEVVLPQGIEKEVIVVDDASCDETRSKLEQYKVDHSSYALTCLYHERNRGKGASIQTALGHVTGEYLIIQDADLEYDPQEYNQLLQPVLKGRADVVYGTRFANSNPHRVLFFWHYIGNKMLTTMSNMFTNLNLTDMETCYKLFRTDYLKQLKLKEKRFGFEPEVTARIARIKGIRIYEVGISYYGRTYEEGKKINWRDGIRAAYCIAKYGLF